MKKQVKAKKLSLQKETLLNFRWATGGLSYYCGDTDYNDTVYYPQPSEQCSRGCPIQV